MGIKEPPLYKSDTIDHRFYLSDNTNTLKLVEWHKFIPELSHQKVVFGICAQK